MIQETSKSTTSVPRIQRFDSLKASKHSPIGFAVMSLAALASIIYVHIHRDICTYVNIYVYPHKKLSFNKIDIIKFLFSGVLSDLDSGNLAVC